MRMSLVSALWALGISAVAIGLAIFFFGPERVATFFVAMLRYFAPQSFATPPQGWSRDADSELRFYCVFWIAYGFLAIAVARNLRSHSNWLPVLMGLLFVGGLGRVLSMLQLGLPHPLFVLLAVIEITLPPIVLIAYLLVKPKLGAEAAA